MDALNLVAEVLNFSLFPIVFIIYLILASKVKLRNIDTVALVILALYFTVFLVRFVGQIFNEDWIGTFPEYLVFVVSSAFLWISLYLFVFEMARVRAALSS